MVSDMCMQATNVILIRAGAAICIEFKVSFDLSKTSGFFFSNCQFPRGSIATQTLNLLKFGQNVHTLDLQMMYKYCCASTTKAEFIIAILDLGFTDPAIKNILTDIQR